jgi:hypothetical protein
LPTIERAIDGKESKTMADKSAEPRNEESRQTLSDDQIITERKLPRRTFLSGTATLLAGGAAVLVSGARAATLNRGPQAQDPDRKTDPDKKKASDPDRAADADKGKAGDPDRRRSSDPDRKTDPDRKKRSDPDRRKADPDKKKTSDPDRGDSGRF